MSIDTRLRSGLQSEAELAARTEPVDLVDPWTEVLRRAERDTHRRRLRVAVAATAAVAAAAVLAVALSRSPGARAPKEPEPAPVPSAQAVEGKWVAGPVPVQRVIDHLAEQGYGEIADQVLEGLRPDEPAIGPDQTIAFRLILLDGQLVGSVSIDGDPATNVDFQAFEVRGDQVAFIQQDTTCESVFAWTVIGDRLGLRLLDDPCGDAVGGVPDAAYQTALYTTIPFQPAR